jgi:hypothetical protein
LTSILVSLPLIRNGPARRAGISAQGQARVTNKIGRLDRPAMVSTTPEADDLSVCLTVKPVGEPDAGNLHVRFDERDVETESWSNH